MDKEVRKWLHDILLGIRNIENYIGEKKVFAEFDGNMLLQDATERNLITIGEAMGLILKKTPDIRITNARRIVDARNRLTHGYDDIESTQVWNIIINHLPLLRSEVEALLEEGLS